MAWRFWRNGPNLPTEPSTEDLGVMRSMAAKHKPVVMLRPRRPASTLPAGASKMGGRPDLGGVVEWPQCPHCRVPLNFVMQLFRRDFPEFPFPADAEHAALFRCPRRHGCGEADRHTAWHFYTGSAAHDLAARQMPPLPEEPTVIPKHVLKMYADRKTGPSAESLRIWAPFDPPVPECQFDPVRTGDWPRGYEDSVEWWGETFENFRRRHTSDEDFNFSKVFDEFTDYCTAREGTKIGGFAAWQQGAAYPTCACGRRKEFVFQLSSQDRDPGADHDAEVRRHGWSDHGIMIGDLGNVYFFVCPSCGPGGIESNWDCG